MNYTSENNYVVTVNEYVYNTLYEDCLDFEFIRTRTFHKGKPDQRKEIATNMTAFLNTLLVNYYEEYQSSLSLLTEDISKSLKSDISFTERDRYMLNQITDDTELTEKIEDCVCHQIFDDTKINEIASDIIAAVNKRNTYTKQNMKTIRFTPKDQPVTAGNKSARNFIEKLEGSVREVLRNVFTSYADKSSDERERILYKKEYELLLKAKKKKKRISFSYTDHMNNTVSDIKISGIVYDIVTARSTGRNYVFLAEDIDHQFVPRTYRLSHFSHINIHSEEGLIPEECRISFDRMKRNGAAFSIHTTELIKVQLTEAGLDRYRKSPLHRPVKLAQSTDDIYCFDCSEFQAVLYFSKFGKDAVILEPASLREQFRTFYEEALSAYTKE